MPYITPYELFFFTEVLSFGENFRRSCLIFARLYNFDTRKLRGQSMFLVNFLCSPFPRHCTSTPTLLVLSAHRLHNFLRLSDFIHSATFNCNGFRLMKKGISESTRSSGIIDVSSFNLLSLTK